jgi:hypothetical protein
MAPSRDHTADLCHLSPRWPGDEDTKEICDALRTKPAPPALSPSLSERAVGDATPAAKSITSSGSTVGQSAFLTLTRSRVALRGAAASFACGTTARGSVGTIATHKHPIQTAVLAVIVIKASFVQ